MNILLTGASGFLGKRIGDHLVKEGCTILTLGRSKTSDIVCDLGEAIPDLQNLSIDGVVHCAGKAHMVPKSEEEKQEFFQVNVEGTRNLLKGLNKVRFFCFISSVSVYGLDKGLNINEKEDLKATDPYGLSKIKGEEIVSEWCRDNGVRCTILRLPLILDKAAPGNFGAMLKGIEKRFYFNIGKGDARKSMVLAGDVAKVILRACEAGGTYNLTDGYHPSFKELSRFIARERNLSPPKHIPLFASTLLGRVGDVLGDRFPVNSGKISKMVSELTFDDTLARASFGWSPEQVLNSDFLKD